MTPTTAAASNRSDTMKSSCRQRERPVRAADHEDNAANVSDRGDEAEDADCDQGRHQQRHDDSPKRIEPGAAADARGPLEVGVDLERAPALMHLGAGRDRPQRDSEDHYGHASSGAVAGR